MKTSRYTEAQIIAILRQAEGGVPVAELCREHGMSNASFYKWRAKYGGMDASLISQMKAMEDAVFVKQVVRRFHAASLISGALISFSGFNQTGPAGCQFRVFPDQRCGFWARAVA